MSEDFESKISRFKKICKTQTAERKTTWETELSRIPFSLLFHFVSIVNSKSHSAKIQLSQTSQLWRRCKVTSQWIWSTRDRFPRHEDLLEFLKMTRKSSDSRLGLWLQITAFIFYLILLANLFVPWLENLSSCAFSSVFFASYFFDLKMEMYWLRPHRTNRWIPLRIEWRKKANRFIGFGSICKTPKTTKQKVISNFHQWQLN